MLRLTRQRRHERGDRGAVTTLVAVLLAGNVLLGMAALAVDVGLLYVEREELQSGADAAALAVAKVCAANRTACDGPAMEQIAVDYADRNARDEESDAAVCGRVLDSGGHNLLPACDAGPSNLTGCIGSPPPHPTPYVEVRTSTRLPDGSTALPPVFAGAVTGTDGVTVAACARVGWGPVTEARVEPAMAISKCEFDAATDHGTVFQPPPGDTGYGGAEPGREVTLRWRPPNGGGCQGIGNGFGWLTGAPNCGRTVRAGNWITGRTSSTTPNGCLAHLNSAYTGRRPVPVAIFDNVDAPTHNNQFHIAGIAMFVVTGWYDDSGSSKPPALGGATKCSTGFCVYGYFTTHLFRAGTGSTGAAHYGALYLKIIG